MRYARSELVYVENLGAAGPILIERLVGHLPEFVGRLGEESVPFSIVTFDQIDQVLADPILLMLGKFLCDFLESFFQKLCHGPIL